MGLFEKLVNRFKVDLVIQRAVQKEWRGDLEGAIEDLEAAVGAAKPTPARLKVLSLLLQKAGRVDDAIAASTNALALAPNQPELIVGHARLLRRAGRFAEALPLISSRYGKDKKNIFVATEYCKLLVDMGRNEEAARVLDETSQWFETRAGDPRMEQNGMSQAFREAQEKLRHAGKH